MNTVSMGGEDLMAQLVAWEMLGREDLDPHRILRSVLVEDLERVQRNLLGSFERARDRFVSCQLIEIELLWRRGMLREDWCILRSDGSVRLIFNFIDHTHWDPRRERLEA